MKKKIQEIFDHVSKPDRLKILRLNKENNADKDGDSDAIREIESIIRPSVWRYARDVIGQDGVPEDGEGWSFKPAIFRKKDGVIEVMLCRVGNKYIPSTCSNLWEAKANSVDDSLAVPCAVDALTWGLNEALAYYLADDISHLRNGKDFPKEKTKQHKRKAVRV